MIEVVVDQIKFSDPTRKFSDVVRSIQGGFSEDVFNLTIFTNERYAILDCGYVFGPEVSGESITITPHGDCDGYMDRDDPRWYMITMIVTGLNNDYTSMITPLKYEYVVSYIPQRLIHSPSRFGEINIDCLRERPE